MAKIIRVNPHWDPSAGQFAGGAAYRLAADTDLTALSDRLEAIIRDGSTIALDAHFNEQPVRLIINGDKLETAFLADIPETT